MRLGSGEVSPIEVFERRGLVRKALQKCSGAGSVFIFAGWEFRCAGIDTRATSCVAARLRCFHRRKWQERQVDLRAF